MSIKQTWFSRGFSAVILASAVYTVPAMALVCPIGEEPSSTNPKQCVKRDAPKPQLDVEKYSGAQKMQAEACNKANAAHASIIETSNEIARINTSINEAQVAQKNAPTPEAKGAAATEVAKWKQERKELEAKLKKAQADENAAKKEHRKAVRQLKKDGGTSLDCI